MADSSDELHVRLADLRVRLDEAQEAAHVARAERSRVAGLRLLGEIDAETLSIASGALQTAETEAADLASAVLLLENRIGGADADAKEVAAAALRGKGKKLLAARDAAIFDFREQASAAAAAIARYDKANGAIAELRDQAVLIFDPEAHHAEVDAEVRSMVDAAPPGQYLNPAVLDRHEQEGRAKVEADAQAAADAVGWVELDGAALREAAIGLPAERLLDPTLARALGAGREMIVAPPGAGHSIRRIYGEAELPMARERYQNLLAAFDRLAIDQPSIADAYGGRGSTVRAA